VSGETDLEKLLTLLQPRLLEGYYVFCTIEEGTGLILDSLRPLASYREEEGLSLLLLQQQADQAGLSYDAVFRGITLSVHSSLEAVGFTAAVAGKLAAHGISANVIAAHYHDHVFVPAERADYALQLLTELES